MRIVRGLPTVADVPLALTIGNFDGVHRGHQAMLERLCEAAEDLRLEPAVLTFDPHPREYFARVHAHRGQGNAASSAASPRLSTVRAKAEYFAALGVSRLIVARFNAELAALSPVAFVDDVLVRRLRARWILVGDDFRFGRARAGDISLLRARAKTFTVEDMAPVVVDELRISSSAVRDALADGNLTRARALLGRPYRISGRVIHGEKRGRTLGFPTANLRLPHLPALSGIFAVQVQGLGKGPVRGVASLGVRPTVVEGGVPLLEVFLFDFNEPIYGRRIAVDFLHKLRNEARYDDLDSLTRQMHADVADARGFFAAQR
jgi:riboflavin kinase/FMN adenylyltransferase